MGRSNVRRVVLAAALVTAVASTAGVAQAGTDGDGVPDGIDNCVLTPNGPGDLSNQVDTDLDGWGNACDTDYDGNGLATTSDYGGLLFLIQMGEAPLVGADLIYDHDGDGYLTLGDLSVFEQIFTGVRPLGQ